MANRVSGFFLETRQELKRVTWPTRHELTASTAVVIVVTLLMAVFIFAIDSVLSVVLRLVFR